MNFAQLPAPPDSIDTAEVGFEQGVPRGLAHQRALAEVLVTDSVQIGVDEFLLGTQLPRSHITWSDRAVPFHDPLVTVEAARQAGFVLAHRYYGVPADFAFISQQITFEVLDVDAYRDDEQGPPEALLRIRLADKQERDGALFSMSFEGELTINGAVAKTMSGTMLFLAPGDFAGLREHLRSQKPLDRVRRVSPPQPVSPEVVGRRLPRNVVIGESVSQPGSDGRSRLELIVDQHHPCFFDHPQDHVPGPLILEAYRQAAVLTAVRAGALSSPAAVLSGCALQFSEFAELDAIVECTAAVIDGGGHGCATVGVALHQFGKQLGEARLELTGVS